MLTAACSVPSTEDIEGDWAGWIYLDDGSDLPVRLGFVREGAGFSGTLDVVSQKTFGLELGAVRWNPPNVEAERVSSQGTRLVFGGALEGDTIVGRTDLGGSTGKLWLHRSPEALSDIDPDTYADCQGTYTDNEGSLVVGSRFWGELLFTDLESGRHGTLFPTGQDEFFAGAALYVPGPVHARARFTRDDMGDVVGLEWRPQGGAPRTLSRRGFREEPVMFASGGVELAGTLIVPEGTGPYPAIAVLGGSNWAERGSVRRDGALFASLGLATLIYDKRGYGESGGEATVPFTTTASDAVAAVRYLKTRDDVRHDRVGITGRSRGGWFAPLAAAQAPELVDFLVLFVAPTVSPAQQESTSRLNTMRADGANPDQLRLAEELLDLTWSFGRTGRGWDAYTAARRQAIEAGVPEHVMETDAADPAEWEWVRLNMHYDPLRALEQVRCPTLALFGGADTNVVPEINLPLMREALERAGNADFQLVKIEGADHGLRVFAPGEEDLPPHLRTGFGPAGWSTVSDWLAVTLSR